MMVNEVYISNSTGNYFRIDEIAGTQVRVTRLGFRGTDGKDVARVDGPYCWPADTLHQPDFRRVAHDATKFEAFIKEAFKAQSAA